MKKRVLSGAILFVLLGSLVACGVKENKVEDSGAEKNKDSVLADEQEFTVLVQAEAPSIDPSVQTDVVGYGISKNTGEGLFNLDSESNPIPAGIQQEPEVNEEGTSYTFYLRKDAKWSNGETVTAGDYVFAWQRTVDPKTGSEFAYLYEQIKNYKPITNGEKPLSELGVKAVNDYELQVDLEQPIPNFEAMLTLPTFYPQNKKLVEKLGDKAYSSSEKAVYNGAFVLKDFDGPGTDMEWVYEKNPEYWGQKAVKMQKININVVKEATTALNLFENGQVDDIIINGEQAKQMQADPSFIAQLQANMMWLQYNQTKKEFQNINLRKAISAAIDREALCQAILGNGSIPATSLIPAGMVKNPTTGKEFTEEAGNYLAYDQKAAQNYWEKAKKELAIDSLTIEILCSDADSIKQVVEYLQGTIETNLPGIKIKIAPVPFSVRLDRGSKQQFDLVMGGWSAMYPDPSNYLDIFTSTSATNNGKYSNATFDAAIKTSNSENVLNEAARWEDQQAENRIIMEDMGVCPLYQSAETHLRNPKIKGIIPAMAQFDYKHSFKMK